MAASVASAALADDTATAEGRKTTEKSCKRKITRFDPKTLQEIDNTADQTQTPPQKSGAAK